MKPRIEGIDCKGFSIMELLVVIAIISVLAATIISAISDARLSAMEARAMTEMQSLTSAMQLLWEDTGLFPHQETEYCPPFSAANNEVDLTTDAAGIVGNDGSYAGWKGPYAPSAIDPWGNPYFLDEDYYCTAGANGCDGHVSVTADRSVVVSCGPDGLIGQDPLNGTPDNSPGCAYNDDNVVHVLCSI